MNERLDNLLKTIVEEHIQTAEPIGSQLIVDKYLKDVSSATIRNAMADLEHQGLICQPYTSAGRIPSIAGYEYYLANLITQKSLTAKVKKTLDQLLSKINYDRQGIKDLAKALAELSGQAMLIGFSQHDVYYTGISNLFKQPEFSQHARVYSLSEIIDHLDEVMTKIIPIASDKVQVLLGDNNPFGDLAAAAIVKLTLNQQSVLLGVLGPVRMDYARIMGLLEHITHKLKSHVR